jgi:hypothetical protein
MELTIILSKRAKLYYQYHFKIMLQRPALPLLIKLQIKLHFQLSKLAQTTASCHCKLIQMVAECDK